MKWKWTIAVAIFFITMGVFASPVDMGYKFEGGWSSHSFGTRTRTEPENDEPDNYYTTLGVNFWFFDTLFVGGSSTMEMNKNNGFGFDPTFNDYMFNSGIKVSNFRFVYQHNCTHPQTTYEAYNPTETVIGEGSLDQIYIEYRKHFYKYGDKFHVEDNGYQLGFLIKGGYTQGSFGEFNIGEGYSYIGNWKNYFIQGKVRLWLLDTLYTGNSFTIQTPTDDLSYKKFTNLAFEFGLRLGHIELFFEKGWVFPEADRNYSYRTSTLWESDLGVTRIGLRYIKRFY